MKETIIIYEKKEIICRMGFEISSTTKILKNPKKNLYTKIVRNDYYFSFWFYRKRLGVRFRVKEAVYFKELLKYNPWTKI